MLGLKSALFLASASTLCMAAPTPSASAPPAAATDDPKQFPVQVKVTNGDLFTFNVKGSQAIEIETLYFAPGPGGCFFDEVAQVTSDGLNSLPFGFQVYTQSLKAQGAQAPTCMVTGCMPSTVPEGPLVFNITDNGLDYLSPCGTPEGWGTVSLFCGGPSASCSAGILSNSS